LLGLFAAGCQAGSASTTVPPGVTDAPRPATTPSVAPSELPVAKPGVTASVAPEAGFRPASASPGASPAALAFALQSTAFNTGNPLPGEFSCDGAGTSPPLAWSGAPVGTKAFALVAEDMDAANSDPVTNWVLYNMPLTVNQLSAGVQASPLLSNGAQQGLNSHQTIGYYGACPNKGDPPHHFAFQLFAQDEYITMETGATAAEVKAALTGHIIAQANLTVTFQR